MRALAILLPVAVLASTVAACTSPVQTIGTSPESIKLRWFNADANFDQAQALAHAYCAERARAPALGDTFTDRDVSLATFDCR
jgi:hypothetical protein